VVSGHGRFASGEINPGTHWLASLVGHHGSRNVSGNEGKIFIPLENRAQNPWSSNP